MRFTTALILPGLLAAAALATVVPGGDPSSGGGGIERRYPVCPSKWRQVSLELGQIFDNDKDKLRASLRAVFHDCFGGSCDGSLQFELDRPENAGTQMSMVVKFLQGMAKNYKTSLSDMIVFAANKAIRVAGGPVVDTNVGRTDSSGPGPQNQIPSPTDNAANIAKLFASKGFNQVELAALMGAHSVSIQRVAFPKAKGLPQDTTPNVMDEKYFQQTLEYAETNQMPKGIFVFPSDQSLATYEKVGESFGIFAHNFARWEVAFAGAMEKMTAMGNNGGQTDCTQYIDV